MSGARSTVRRTPGAENGGIQSRTSRGTMSTSSSTTRPGRLLLTGVAWLYMLLAIPVVVLFCLEVTFIPLTIITIGLVALLAIVPMVAGVATLHRRLAEVVLGEPVPSPYREVPSGGMLVRLSAWARDPARWRDLLWMFVAMTLGWVMAILAVGADPVRRVVPVLPGALRGHAEGHLRPAARVHDHRHPGRDLPVLDRRRRRVRAVVVPHPGAREGACLDRPGAALQPDPAARAARRNGSRSRERTPSTSRRPSCAASSATCTTGRRPGWSPSA